jgi:hypothetical protein
VNTVRGHTSTRFLSDTIEVEDTAEFVAEHAGGARSVFYATLANPVNAPVTVDVVAEKGTLRLLGRLSRAADPRLLRSAGRGRPVLDQPPRSREVSADRAESL